MVVLKKGQWIRDSKELAFVRPNGRSLSISSEVRDWILPHRFVRVSVEEEVIILAPTDDTSEYRVTITNGQAKIAYDSLRNVVELNPKYRYPAEKVDEKIIISLLEGYPVD